MTNVINPLSASIDVEIKGMLAITRYELTYHNQQSTPVEAIYHFSLPRMASVLSCEVEVHGKRLVAQLKKRSDAAAQYENAVEKRQRSVLIESLNDGLYAINMGNVDCNQHIAICLTIAQLLQASQHTLTYRLPTHIAPHYGSSNNDIEPEYNLFARYPFKAVLRSEQPLQVASASHPIKQRQDDYCFNGELDRDIFVSFTSTDELHFYQASFAEHDYLLGYLPTVAESTPTAATEEPNAARLHLMLDRSGSMAGSSIQLCKEAVSSLLNHLASDTQINLCSFGSEYDMLFKGLQPLNGDNLKRLRQHVQLAQADMGGTELCEALLASLKSLQADPKQPNHLLLITDGQVYMAEEQLAAISLLCQRSHTIIHTIGVGYSVDEHIVRRLADINGGLCQIVNPNGELSHAITDIQQVLNSVSQTAPVYQAEAGKWLHCPKRNYSGLNQIVVAAGQALHLAHNQQALNLTTLEGEWARALVHLAAVHHMLQLPASEAETLAEQLGILSKYTSFVMVDSSASISADAVTQVVPQMAPPYLLRSVTSDADEYLDIPASLRGPRHFDENIQYLKIPAFLNKSAVEDEWASTLRNCTAFELALLDDMSRFMWRIAKWDSIYLLSKGLTLDLSEKLEALAQKYQLTFNEVLLAHLAVYVEHFAINKVPLRSQRRLNQTVKRLPVSLVVELKETYDAVPSL